MSEIATAIAGHLRQVGRALRSSGSDPDEIQGILEDIEDQIQNQLNAISDSPSMADINAVLSRMDPPSSFGTPSRRAPDGTSSGKKVLVAAIVLLCLVATGIAIHYVIVDARIEAASEENISDADSEELAASSGTDLSSSAAVIAPQVPDESASSAPAAASERVATSRAIRIPIAIASFSTSSNLRDRDAVHTTVSDGLVNALAFYDGLRLVERAKMAEGLTELRMGSEGLLDQSTALKLGKIVGAQVIVTGSIVLIDDQLIITARLINAETSELSATRVTGSRFELLSLCEELATSVAERITNDPTGALARRPDDEDSKRIREKQRTVKEAIAGKALPRVLVMIPETHLRQRIPDPAGETELVLWLTDCGFLVASPEYSGIKPPAPVHQMTRNTDIAFRRNRGWRNEEGSVSVSSEALSEVTQKGLGSEREKLLEIADVIILGEGISERASRRSGLISCKARVELKAIDVKSGQVLLAASAYGAGIDVAEHIAGKRALQAAGRNVAVEIIPQLVDRWEKLADQ